MDNIREYGAGWDAFLAGEAIDVNWSRMRKIGWHNANGTKYDGGP